MLVPLGAASDGLVRSEVLLLTLVTLGGVLLPCVVLLLTLLSVLLWTGVVIVPAGTARSLLVPASPSLVSAPWLPAATLLLQELFNLSQSVFVLVPRALNFCHINHLTTVLSVLDIQVVISCENGGRALRVVFARAFGNFVGENARFFLLAPRVEARGPQNELIVHRELVSEGEQRLVEVFEHASVIALHQGEIPGEDL